MHTRIHVLGSRVLHVYFGSDISELHCTYLIQHDGQDVSDCLQFDSDAYANILKALKFLINVFIHLNKKYVDVFD